jgi:hypothetical protein
MYDNLPVVDSRIWSKDGKDCALTVDAPVKDFTAIEHGQALEVVIRFRDGRHGLIYLAPDGISFEACGVLNYTVGVPNDTTVAYADGAFTFTHNHFDYTVPVAGCSVEETEGGYRLVPAAAVRVDMSQR